MKAHCIRGIVLLVASVSLAVPAIAGSGPADPFAESHARLIQAADFHLAQARRSPVECGALAPLSWPHRIPPPGEKDKSTAELTFRTPYAKREAGESEGLAAIRPEAVAAARERLRALGVEADRIFAEEGVPQALLVVAQVESNFDPLALSPKGARGLWQLMPETAARFGLRVDAGIDERTHPVPATRAAARYLRELYLRFGDWLLALAAYNAGEGRVESALARAASGKPSPSFRASFWHLATLGLLPEETRRYVPAILARL
jgi:hypothetical protein